MHPLRSVLAITLLYFGGNALGQTTLETPNETVTGEELFVVCTFCHGDSLQGNDRRDGPALAGLEAWYLELQMQNYRNGIRGYLAEDIPGQVMHFTKGMLRNDYTISSLAEYISALEPGKPMAANAIGERPYLWESHFGQRRGRCKNVYDRLCCLPRCRWNRQRSIGRSQSPVPVRALHESAADVLQGWHSRYTR